jgi:hypothetical protein
MYPDTYPHKQADGPGTREVVLETMNEPVASELLAGWGFSAEEISSLLWLRQWYQSGGGDRASIVRELEFLKLLVHAGELEL